MDLLKPPTDNLYKFLALSGVLLFVISIFYPVWQWYRIKERSIEVSRDKELLLADLNRFKAQTEADIQIIDELVKEEEEGKYKTDPIERVKQLQQRKQKRASLEFETQKKSIELNSKRSLLDLYSRVAILITLAGLAGIVAGLFTSMLGFRLWYSRLQKHQDMILQKDAEKVTLSKDKTLEAQREERSSSS